MREVVIEITRCFTLKMCGRTIIARWRRKLRSWRSLLRSWPYLALQLIQELDDLLHRRDLGRPLRDEELGSVSSGTLLQRRSILEYREGVHL